MAYTVAKILGLRPSVILTEWSCAELLVAFGIYTNRQMREAYEQYQRLDAKVKRTIKAEDKPSKYAIEFLTFTQLEERYSRPSEEEESSNRDATEELLKLFEQGGGSVNGR
ncbi:MAG: hypothetical protein ACK5LJ_08090 [Paracoccus sp. (in: a-proteobacteria)]